MRDTAHAEGHETFGHLVAPGINAPNHQHFFSYRLDLDVDGSANTVFETETHAAPAANNPKGELSRWVSIRWRQSKTRCATSHSRPRARGES